MIASWLGGEDVVARRPAQAGDGQPVGQAGHERRAPRRDPVGEGKEEEVAGAQAQRQLGLVEVARGVHRDGRPEPEVGRAEPEVQHLEPRRADRRGQEVDRRRGVFQGAARVARPEQADHELARPSPSRRRASSRVTASGVMLEATGTWMASCPTRRASSWVAQRTTSATPRRQLELRALVGPHQRRAPARPPAVAGLDPRLVHHHGQGRRRAPAVAPRRAPTRPGATPQRP